MSFSIPLDFQLERVYTLTMLMTKPSPSNKKVDALSRQLQEAIQERDDEIRRLYVAYKRDPLTGWTLERIAEKYGLTKQRVYQIWMKGKSGKDVSD